MDEDEALLQLHFAYRRIVEEPDRILARRGLNRVHHRVLFFIRRLEGVSVGALSKALQVSKQALHAPLKELVAHRLVAIDATAGDRRKKQLRLTASGAALEERLSGLQRRRLAQAFSAVGASGARAWHDVMRSVAGL
jgi:DNA-binding MarR family transcriptional regulator